MKYALLIYGDEQGWADASSEERERVYAQYTEFGQLLESRNAVRGGEELELTSAATTVRRNGDDVLVTDGHLDRAEDALQDAFAIALESWPPRSDASAAITTSCG